MATRKLPIGIQGFEMIRREGYLYVDKTDMVWEIANGRTYNFLSRPRRFGKSLLTSTLKCYFEGKKGLFEGLKIMELEKEWPKRQVFSFDFSGKETAEVLDDYIAGKLKDYEEIYGKSNFTDINTRLVALMMKAHEKTGHQVAVLVDEYDAPLQHTLFKEDEHEKVVEIYRSFFPALKTAGDHLKCLFLTGITKFTQLSLFSTLNTISIIGTWEKYATVCGITQQEILDNFQPELEAMGKKNGWTTDETIAKLKDMYDGYRFSEDDDPEKMVYNPYSLICALDARKISNYWAASGGSFLLMKMLQATKNDGQDLDGSIVKATTFEEADVSLSNLPLFLYQLGYLTIENYNGRVYKLGFPNTEVRDALYEVVLPNIIDKSESTVESAIESLYVDLDEDNIDEMMKDLKQLFAETQYSQNSNEYLTEERYRFIMRQTFSLVGCKIEEEKQISTGRIDMVAKFRNKIILVFELKMDVNGGVEEAKKQIVENNYLSAFSNEKMRVYGIAVSFSSKKRGIENYEILGPTEK